MIIDLSRMSYSPIIAFSFIILAPAIFLVFSPFYCFSLEERGTCLFSC